MVGVGAPPLKKISSHLGVPSSQDNPLKRWKAPYILFEHIVFFLVVLCGGEVHPPKKFLSSFVF